MNLQNSTNTDTNNGLARPDAVRTVPPDQISPKAVILRVLQLKHVFRRNWKLMVILAAIGGTIGFVYDLSYKRKPIYTATLKFNLGGGSGSSSFGELGALASAFGLGQAAPEANIFVGDNFMTYAKSRPLIEKTLMDTVRINGNDTLLINYYIQHSGIRDEDWEENDTLRAFSFSQAKETKDFSRQEAIAMSQIYNRIVTEMGVEQPERKSSFMVLRSGMQDEMLAKTFVEKHMESIQEDYRQKQTKKTREMLTLLSRRADSLGNRLSGTENRLAQYQDQNQQIVAAQGRVVENKLARNSTFLSGLYFQAIQNVENMRLTLIREAPLFTVIEPVYLPLYKETKRTIGLQAGIVLGLILSLVIIFLKETYRSIMQEG